MYHQADITTVISVPKSLTALPTIHNQTNTQRERHVLYEFKRTKQKQRGLSFEILLARFVVDIKIKQL